MTVNTETRWWKPLDEADGRLRASPYVAPYVNLRECSPDVLCRLATWLRELASLLDQGAALKEARDADAS